MLTWRIPRIARFVFFYARVTSWLPARVGRVRQEGVIPCRMVPSMWDEVHGQLHGVTGKVQQARLIVAVQRCSNCELPCWMRNQIYNELIRKQKKKKKQASLSGGHGFPGQG